MDRAEPFFVKNYNSAFEDSLGLTNFRLKIDKKALNRFQQSGWRGFLKTRYLIYQKKIKKKTVRFSILKFLNYRM